MGMSDEEFYNIYGRLPRKKKPKKVKIYWGRIIIALLILIGIIVGFVKLVGFVADKLKGDKSAEEAVKESSSSSLVEVEDPEEPEPKKYVAAEYSNVQLIVCIDAGHGDYDVGTASNDGSKYEKDDCLRLALKVKEYLEKCGVKVVMTRNDDTFVELGDRCSIANNANCDMFISIHRNSYDGDISGVEAWVNNAQPAADTTLANTILNKLTEVGVADNRGVQFGYVGDPYTNYYVNADTVMPSTLLEVGFMTSEKDNELFDLHCDEYGDAIGEAVILSAIELGVVDSSGTRLLSQPLISEEKYINRPDSEKTGTGDQTYPEDGSYDGDGAYYYASTGEIFEETEPSVTPEGNNDAW